jgi:hypothetical protein
MAEGGRCLLPPSREPHKFFKNIPKRKMRFYALFD